KAGTPSPARETRALPENARNRKSISAQAVNASKLRARGVLVVSARHVRPARSGGVHFSRDRNQGRCGHFSKIRAVRERAVSHTKTRNALRVRLRRGKALDGR